ncbi:hypothetical protein BC629DRAFT_1577212 [Irpex lacteus]|nr:hypothetical protein BC629DRAFT_1577212 [Irpex lacteus]
MEIEAALDVVGMLCLDYTARAPSSVVAVCIRDEDGLQYWILRPSSSYSRDQVVHMPHTWRHS